MRIVYQRVLEASVCVDNSELGRIGHGAVVFVGIQEQDDKKTLQLMLDKIINLRVFEDDEGKMNRSLLDVGGGLLIIPNFTLYGDARQGRRPSYIQAAKPEISRSLFTQMIQMAQSSPLPVAWGQFGADMKIQVLNDGPVTILLDSDKTF